MNLRCRHLPGRLRRGLTLNEMLIVLAVFSILAILFLFSSQTAMVKTRVSRVLQEHRLIARALQAYEADTLQIPPESAISQQLRVPPQYLTHTPQDPFLVQKGLASEYQYFAKVSPREKWVLVSSGPDGDSDLQEELERRTAKPSQQQSDAASNWYRLSDQDFKQLRVMLTYDPTNGSVSNGDLISVYTEQ